MEKIFTLTRLGKKYSASFRHKVFSMKLSCFLLICFVLLSCADQHKTTKSLSTDGYVTTPSGLKYTILQKGSGDTAKEGHEVLIFETTSYRDGTVLYSNENSTNPVKVLIGGHQATDGVDEGLRGMQVGEVRRLIAPPELVKRKSYPANVSPDSTLVIKIILHKIL
jgi:FKBP-type peptidyl-prolyl cis-trans isomerase